MIEISEEQWAEYQSRYGNLIKMISMRITGDRVLANSEDNVADLEVAALESIKGFHKKTGETVDQMFKNKLFDQYTKTCLWNHKNSKGIKQEKKRPFFSKCVSIDSAGEDDPPFSPLEMSHYDTSDITIYQGDKLGQLPDREQVVLKAILDDPSMLRASGKINIREVAKKLGCSWPTAQKVVKSLLSKVEGDIL